MTINSAPKILHVLPSLISGGVERNVIDIVNYLKKAGYTTFVASSGGKMCAILKKIGVRHCYIPFHSKNPLRMLLNIFSIIKLVKKHSITLIHTHSRAPAWSSFLAAKYLNIPLITTYNAKYNAKTKLKKIYNSVMARGDYVIPVSNYIMDHIIKEYNKSKWFNEKKLCLIYYGANLSHFSGLLNNSQIKKVNELSSLVQNPQSNYVFLLPARFSYGKGHELLIEAVKELPKTYLDKLKIIFVGDQSKRANFAKHIKKKILQATLDNIIILLDNQDDMVPLYSVVDVVISASTQPEGFSLIIVEAGAMAKPILASNCGPTKEVVLHNETGWLFNDKKDLIKYLKKILDTDKTTLKLLGINAQKHIQNNFSKEKALHKTLDLYKKAAIQK